ncbi:hydrogenase [Fodinisporobacter ferrooxydans]|uniref:Hydrogenase n=1 Tax=Fodinisporobacter ferrooxydans TaxID=2901836 RepID=A0ABY4CGK0_9BACL|nr:hydrogenase [Alicyclobacillaceae bacterium MYW30-H2]
MLISDMFDVLSFALMICSIAIVGCQRIVTAIRILALQSFILGGVAIATAYRTHVTELYGIAFLTILLKGIIIPWILHFTMRKIGLYRQTEKVFSREWSILISTALLIVGYSAIYRLGLNDTYIEKQYLPISIAILLIGLFVMMTHKKAVMQGIGLIVMENGLFLTALSMTYGMPSLVEIGVFFDVVVAVVLISTLTRRMEQMFQSTNTDQLRRLKG